MLMMRTLAHLCKLFCTTAVELGLIAVHAIKMVSPIRAEDSEPTTLMLHGMQVHQRSCSVLEHHAALGAATCQCAVKGGLDKTLWQAG